MAVQTDLVSQAQRVPSYFSPERYFLQFIIDYDLIHVVAKICLYCINACSENDIRAQIHTQASPSSTFGCSSAYQPPIYTKIIDSRSKTQKRFSMFLQRIVDNQIRQIAACWVFVSIKRLILKKKRCKEQTEITKSLL